MFAVLHKTGNGETGTSQGQWDRLIYDLAENRRFPNANAVYQAG